MTIRESLREAAMADTPEWNEAGEPLNLKAAAKDADMWLEYMQQQTSIGRWKFTNPDNHAKLADCRAMLNKFRAAGGPSP